MSSCHEVLDIGSGDMKWEACIMLGKTFIFERERYGLNFDLEIWIIFYLFVANVICWNELTLNK